MDSKDLLKLLDLGARPRDAPASDTTTVVMPSESAARPGSPTAFSVDAWGLRRGRDLLAESERMRQARTDAFAAADFFTAAFDPDPRWHEAPCNDRCRREFLGQLLDTPEYHALHAATRLNDTAAGIAAAHFAEQFAKLAQDDATSPADELGREMAALRAVGRALTEAEREVSELHEATAALGLGPGMPGSNDPAAIATLFRQVRGDPALRRICELAGRFRRVAQSKQRLKTRHGLDDVVGVEAGGEIGRLLPSELARLMLPELELDTLRRIVEREAQCREHHAVEPIGKGPIIVSVDESGSMVGEKVHTAKALALALAWIARQQRRWCGLVGYSGETGERVLALPPGRWNEAALCDWLGEFIGGGSSLDVPIQELPRMAHALGAPAGATDVILVTDAICRIPTEIAESFRAWKLRARVRVIALVIENEPGDLAALCEETHIVRSLNPDGAAVGRIL